MEAGVTKQQLIWREFGREPMYHAGPPSTGASVVTDGGDGTAVRFRLLPRSGQLSVDGEPADIGGRAFDLLLRASMKKTATPAPDRMLSTELRKP